MTLNVPTDPLQMMALLVSTGVFMAIVTGVVEGLKRKPINLDKDWAPTAAGGVGLLLGIVIALVWATDLQTRTLIILLGAALGFGGSGVYAWFGAAKPDAP